MFFKVLEAEKSKIKVLADSVPGEALLLVCRQVPSFCILTWWREREGSSSSYKDTNHILKGSVLRTLFKPNYLTKTPPPNTVNKAIRASTYK